jgi:hypothetical protein
MTRLAMSTSDESSRGLRLEVFGTLSHNLGPTQKSQRPPTERLTFLACSQRSALQSNKLFLMMKFMHTRRRRRSSIALSTLVFCMGAVIGRFIGCVRGAIEKTHQRSLRAVPNESTLVTAVIKLKENVDAASFEIPEGAEVLYRFKYINAVSVRMPGTLATKLSVDSNIAYISQDKYMYPMTETVPWGIPAIQANDPSVPLPEASQPCFKVCIVDGGFSLGHVDLVCTKPLSVAA